MRKVWLFPLMVLVFLLTACSGQAAASTAAPTAATTRPHDDTTTATTTATPTPTPTATATATPSPTPTPTPTPTISLPVSLGTPLPPLEPIGDQWGEVQEVAQYSPHVPAKVVSSGRYTVLVYWKNLEIIGEDGQVQARVPVRVNPAKDKIAAGQNIVAVVRALKNEIQVYDWTGKEVLRIAPDDGGNIQEVRVSPDGALVAYTTRKGYDPLDWWFYVVAVSDGDVRFRQHAEGGVQFSEDGHYFAVFFDRRLHVYDVNSGQEAYSVWADWGDSYAFSPTGEKVAIYHPASKAIEVYTQGKLKNSIHQRRWGLQGSQPVQDWVQLVFSAKGDLLAVFYVQGQQSRYALFDLSTGKRLEKAAVEGECARWAIEEKHLVCKRTVGTSALGESPPELFTNTAQGWKMEWVGRSHCLYTKGGEIDCRSALSWAAAAMPLLKAFGAPAGLEPDWLGTSEDGQVTGAAWVSGYGLNTDVLVRTRDGKRLWARTFVNHSLSGLPPLSIAGYALAPHGKLFAIVGVSGVTDDYPPKGEVRFITLKRGVKRPSALAIPTPPKMVWGEPHVPIAFCGLNYLAVAVEGNPLSIYDLRTGKVVRALKGLGTVYGLVCEQNALAVLDASMVLHVFGIPALDKGGSNP